MYVSYIMVSTASSKYTMYCVYILCGTITVGGILQVGQLFSLSV